MGKKAAKAGETIPNGADAVKSLFAPDNPFRRAPHPASDPPGEHNRKRTRAATPEPSPSPAPESVPKKRKKLEGELGDEESPEKKKKRRKRKRDELEIEYEKRKLGSDADEEEDGRETRVAVGEKRKAEDVAKEEMATAAKDEGFDDESKLLRTVFVGNLPLRMKKKLLMKEFGKFGEVESVRIRSVPIVDSKIPRKGAIIKGKINDAVDSVHAYIVFKDEQSAHAALSHNMVEVGGNHIRVDMACPPRKKMRGEAPLYDRKKTVFVGNLPFDVKDEELYQLFSTCGPSESSVEAIRVIRDPHTSMGKGIAYVLFKTRDAANLVARRRDLKIRDRPLRLCHAKSDTTPPSKRKDAASKWDFPRKKLAVTSSDASSGRKDRPKVKAASLSYQGLRASKSGVLKKAGLRSRSDGKPNKQERSDGKPNKQEPDQRARKAKRPAVAARKAKFLKKRKQESGTPENTHRNKRARH